MQNTLFSTIKENWFLIVFFGSLIFSWATFTVTVSGLQTDMKDVQNRVEAQQLQQAENYRQLTNSVSRIEAIVERLDTVINRFDITYTK